MQGENQRSLTTMLLVAGAFLAVYYAANSFFGEPARDGDQGGAEQAQASPEQRARRDAEARRDAPDRQARRRTATITTDAMVVTIDSLGGGLREARLSDPHFGGEAGPVDVVSTSREEYQPLRIDLPGVEIPADAEWALEQESPTSVRMRWEGRGVSVVRRIAAGDGPFQLWQTVRVRNLSAAEKDLRLRVSTWHYVPRAEEGGSMFGQRSPAISQGLCRHDEETERKTRQDLATRHGYRGAIDFVAVENVYFVQALAPEGPAAGAEFCGMQTSEVFAGAEEPDGTLFEASLVYPSVGLAPGAEHTWRTLAFLGPKSPAALERAGHALPEVVNLGTFAVIARAFAALLTFIQGHVGNWGIAIIILTLLVRLALFPLTDRSFRSMAQIRKLKPEMDEINARFADDAEKKNAAVMDLYRKHGINPLAQLGGCLPVLLQMPVFFALYTSLSTNVELYHRPFALWWSDLSAPDPFFVLPLALGGLMYLQQKITPTNMDPAQARMMQFMPVIVTTFMLFLPAGLCLYMLTNSVLGISQQKLNEWRLSRESAAAVAVDSGAQAGNAPGADDSKDTSQGGGGTKASPSRGTGRSRRG